MKKIKLGQFDDLLHNEIEKQKKRIPSKFRIKDLEIKENIFSFSIKIRGEKFSVYRLQSEENIKKEIQTIVNQFIISKI